MNKGSFYRVNRTIYKTYGVTLQFIATYDNAMRSDIFRVEASGQ
jgi:hypothetical protein